AEWFAEQLAMFASPEPERWKEWLIEGILDWRNRWLPALGNEPAENKNAADCAVILNKFPAAPALEQCAEMLQAIREADADWPSKKKTIFRALLKGFFDEAAFFRSLARSANDKGKSPLAQDWGWVRSHLSTLLQLAREFTSRFGHQKKELGVVDFHDIEQHALELLWDRKTGLPTKTAQQWRKKLRFVFVDEY